MAKTYVTFGQVHVHELLDQVFDKDCVAVINDVKDAFDGRRKAFDLFGRKFCFEYYEDEFDPEIMRYFPRGFVEVSPELLESYDPTPYCHVCGAMEKAQCDCGPYADNH